MSVSRLCWHILWWIHPCQWFAELWTITSNPFSQYFDHSPREPGSSHFFLPAWGNHWAISCVCGIEKYGPWTLRLLCLPLLLLSGVIPTAAGVHVTVWLSSFPWYGSSDFPSSFVADGYLGWSLWGCYEDCFCEHSFTTLHFSHFYLPKELWNHR